MTERLISLGFFVVYYQKRGGYLIGHQQDVSQIIGQKNEPMAAISSFDDKMKDD